MYKKRILQGLALFIIFWILLPAAIVTGGSLLGGIIFNEPVKVLGKVLAAIGFTFSMIASSYLITDGGGGPMFCCPPKKLVRCGPFSMCRHPIYLGFSLYISGLSLSYSNLGSLASSLTFSALTFIYALTIEERKLKETFPEYEEYRKNTPAFFPKLPKKDDRCPPLLFNFLFFVGHIVQWFTWDIRFEKECEVPEEGFVVVSNHVTYLDFAVVVYTISRFISFPVSLFHYERHKWLYKNVGSFPISRHKPDVKAIVKMISFVKKGGRLGIFPESERSWDGRFLGFKEGFEKLLSKLPKPYVGLRIEKAHLLFPRWGKRFYPGKVFVKVKCFDDPKKLEEFLSKPSVDENDTYASYKGVENYVYMCPRCGSVESLKSSKDGITCKSCGFSLKKPSAGTLWKIRENLKERLSIPFTDHADILNPYGKVLEKNVKVTMHEDHIDIGKRRIDKDEVKAFLLEGRREVFIYDGKEMIGMKFKKSSALLWNDLYEKFWKE